MIHFRLFGYQVVVQLKRDVIHGVRNVALVISWCEVLR
jgi:hypothetical protein